MQNFYKSRDNKWLGILFPRYTLMLLGVSMKILKQEEEAKDIVQQIFLKALNELKKYEVDYFKSWIYMMAKNECLMKLRKSKEITVELREELVTSAHNEIPAEEHWENERILNSMADSLSQLKEEQQKCISLFYLEKKSYTEISAATGFTLLQVKSFLQNGKRNLKLLMEEKIKRENKNIS